MMPTTPKATVTLLWGQSPQDLTIYTVHSPGKGGEGKDTFGSNKICLFSWHSILLSRNMF